MLQSDFMAHLARKGVLRDPLAVDGGMRERRRDALGDVDWVGLTKLTPSGFADELAAFYRCDRVQRRDLVGSRFAGAQLSPRFLKEEHLFPYEHPSGTLTLAIARPVEDETIRAAEVALRQSLAIVVATADDIDDWDSLRHVGLVVNVEAAFGIKFTSLEVASLANVGEMLELIERKRG